MPVSKDDVQKVAQLARLDFAPEDEAQLIEDLNRMLEYVAALDQLDTTEVAPTAHCTPPGKCVSGRCNGTVIGSVRCAGECPAFRTRPLPRPQSD